MAAYDLNPVFDNIINQHAMGKNMFSFYLSPVEGDGGSKITFGGYDSTLVDGPIHYHNVVDEYYWTL